MRRHRGAFDRSSPLTRRTEGESYRGERAREARPHEYAATIGDVRPEGPGTRCLALFTKLPSLGLVST
jgi:hypothetical protein